jgi:hypothetical protein
VRFRTIVCPALFVCLTALRTWRISEEFWLLGDQILYWNIALRPWRELPLGGGPSSVGGTTLGPAFMWTMWAIRHAIGPWTDYLPHAGGIGLSLIQSAADVLLLIGVWRRFGSLPLALAVTLIAATGPEELSLTATIWNPVLAAAFIKAAIAFVLIGGEGSPGWSAAATAAAVLALQSHSVCVFFTVPLIAALPAKELLARGPRAAIRGIALSSAVVLLLEIPFLIDRAQQSGRRASPSAVVASVNYTMENPGAWRPAAAYRALVDAGERLLLAPWRAAGFAWFLSACMLAMAVRARSDPALLAVTVGPLLSAAAGFSLWQRAYQHYWFLPLMPCAALSIGLALTAWKPAARAAAVLMLVVVVAAQPCRVQFARTLYRLPEYGVLVSGSQEIRRRAPEVRRIDLDFRVPPTTDRDYLYTTILGGRISPTAPFSATIERSGHVRFVPAR